MILQTFRDGTGIHDACFHACYQLDCVSDQPPATLGAFLGGEYELSFPHSPSPMLSVVVLTHNQGSSTYVTLLALLSEMKEVERLGLGVELIMVDNASTDWDVQELYSRVRNVVVKLIPSNSGWAHANNVAESCAAPSSKFVLFLNNDAVPQSGFLMAYFRAFYGGSGAGLQFNSLQSNVLASKTTVGSVLPVLGNVGAVACKILFMDGKLQEAGSMAFHDGITSGYGRGSEPSHPMFNHRRLVDYGSGACLAVRRDVFKILKGFDEVTFPSYYEDTDFCMRMRYKLGYDVLYAPDAAVLHHESLSFGRSEANRIMALSAVSFSRKWVTELYQHHMSVTAPSAHYCSRDRRPGLRVLAVDDSIRDPDKGAGYPRARMLHLAISSLGHSLTVLPALWGTVSSTLAELSDAGVEVYSFDGVSGVDAIRQLAVERADGYDVVIISRPNTFNATFDVLSASFPSAVILYDAEALWSRREFQALKLKNDKSRPDLTREVELRAISLADRFTVVSEPEKAFMLNMAPFVDPERIFVVGHMTTPLSAVPPVGPKRRYIVFLGAFHGTLYYNGDAAVYMLTQIIPLVRRVVSIDDSPVIVAGYQPPAELLALSNDSARITVQGAVASLDDFFAEALMLVVPHMYASGIPMKAFDAAARGVPVVISTACNSGLGATEEDGFIVASTAAELAHAIVRLLDVSAWSQWSKKALVFSGRNDEKSFVAAVARALDVPRRVCLMGPAPPKLASLGDQSQLD